MSMDWIDDCTEKAALAIQRGVNLARENEQSMTHPINVTLALLNENPLGPEDEELKDGFLRQAIVAAGGNPDAASRALQRAMVRLPKQNPPPLVPDFHPDFKEVGAVAKKLGDKLKDKFISQDMLLIGLMKNPTVGSCLREASLSFEKMTEVLLKMRGDKTYDKKSSESYSGNGEFENLSKYATDLTALAEEGKLDPVIGRDNEIRRVIRILCRRTKNNPVLIGSPGVGKSAIVEGLAQRIIKRDVPASLIGKLFSLDMGALMAGAKYRGEYEERIKGVLDEVAKSSEKGPGVILFIDEMHLLMTGQESSGGSMDAANLLKPLLARGKLRCIGATTLDEYSKYIEKDAALERRFSQVIVREPTVPETINILRGIREKYEVHHGVKILDPALVAAAELAHRYLTQRRLPDSAIDLVDECCANVKAERETRPEVIDNLERKRLELDIEIHALEREKDQASKERLQAAKKAMADIDEQLRPLMTAYEAERKTQTELNEAKKKLDALKAKADEAERKYDVATASDIRYYALPEVKKLIESLEAKKAQEDQAEKKMVADAVTPEAIAEVVGRWTGIPVSRLLSSEKEKLLKMERILSRQVVGQPEAVTAVANAIRLSRSGLANASRPIASFLFAGPSGTGKTLLSKTLATLLFDSPDAMIRIDASEYTEKHSIARLIGAPPGYIGHDEGGQLTDYVRRKPFSIVLIDEIEKASKEFCTLFLQVLDDGRLTDSKGRVVDFRNTVIIMTSNLGAAYLNDVEDIDGGVPEATKQLVMAAIRGHFVPEFINRIDDIVIFRTLSHSNMSQIVNVRLKEIQQRLNHKKITIDLDAGARQHLAATGYSHVYGARPLNRAIQSELLNPLSRLILEDRVRNGEVVKVTFDEHYNRLLVHPNHALKEEDRENSMDIDDAELEEEEKWVSGGAKWEGERSM